MEFDRDALLRTFIAESEEGLAAMEEVLTLLEQSPADGESLATIFRHAHTLKGNAASFGFSAISEFAHVVEDLLERLRGGSLSVSEEIITCLLQSVDLLGEMLPAAVAGDDRRHPEEPTLRARLQQLAAGEAGPGGSAPATRTEEVERLDLPTTSELELLAASEVHTGSLGIPTIEVERIRAESRRHARSLRVDLDKLDRLLDLTGELCISRGHVAQMLEDPDRDRDSVLEAHRDADLLYVDLQELVMKLRMVPVGPTFQHLVRIVRDLARIKGKQVRVVIEGEDVEVDTTVIERLRDPLTHMVRNAIDHGIETPEKREALGKDARGRLSLNAYHDAGTIVIELEDDGAGLDRERVLARAGSLGLDPGTLTEHEIHELVFRPGFSTAESVSELSGRGVGMDVVRRNIEALRGTVTVQSEKNKGMRVTIRLPLTLAIIEGFHVGVGAETYIIPLEAVVETAVFPATEAYSRLARGLMYVRGRGIPFVRLRSLFQVEGPRPSRESVVIVEHDAGQAGLVVDSLQGHGQNVIKPLGKLLHGLPSISASAILGRGEVAFILDVPDLLRRASDPAKPARAETAFCEV